MNVYAIPPKKSILSIVRHETIRVFVAKSIAQYLIVEGADISYA